MSVDLKAGLLLSFFAFFQSGPPGRVLSVEEMAGKTAVAGVAVVRGSSVRRDDRNGMIYTDYRLRFTEVWKGNPGDDFILMKAGGRIGDRVTSIAGQDYDLRAGENVVVFASASSLGNHTVMGLRQGLYRVREGPDRALQRESERTASPIPLLSLKAQVFKALGKAAPETPAAETTEKQKLETPAPLPEPAGTALPEVPARGTSTTPSQTRGLAWTLMAVLLFGAIAWAYLRRRHGRA